MDSNGLKIKQCKGQHDRNFLRHEVLPRLDQRFVGWRRRIETALGRDESFGQAVDEAVSRDLEVCLDGLGLRVDRLIKYSHARQRMILRRFLRERCPQQPSGSAIDEFWINCGHRKREDVLSF